MSRLFEQTGGALALVSGRPIADLDRLFTPLKLPAIGGHGAEMRVHGTKSPLRRRRCRRICAQSLRKPQRSKPGIVVEDKGYSLALHYRNAPQQEAWLLRQIAATCAAFPGEATEVLPGKSMFEVKRPGVNKGDGVRQLMTQTPFAGRTPVFIGDDVTDESVFAVIAGFGRQRIFGRPAFRGLAGMFESPEPGAPRIAAACRQADRRSGHDRLRPRPCGDRQRPHRGAGQPALAHRVVVPAAL